MKIRYFAIFAIILTTSACYAQSDLTEEDYRNIDQTRAKLVRMKHEMDRFIKDLASTYADNLDTPYGQDVRVDIKTTDTDYMVTADLPGMSKDKIEVTLQNGKLLRISGERDVMTKEESIGVVKQERMKGRFDRTIELPGEGEIGGIAAKYKDGVLEVVIPKKKSAKEESIKISVK